MQTIRANESIRNWTKPHMHSHKLHYKNHLHKILYVILVNIDKSLLHNT